MVYGTYFINNKKNILEQMKKILKIFFSDEFSLYFHVPIWHNGFERKFRFKFSNPL